MSDGMTVFLWFVVVAVVFVVPFLFFFRKSEGKSKEIELQSEKTRQNKPIQTAKTRPAPPPTIQTSGSSEIPNRYNYWITFPKKLSNGQVMDKEYIKIPIKPSMRSFSEYHGLSLGEPLWFTIENNDEPSIAVYQGRSKVGYLTQSTGIFMTRDRLKRGNTVIGFFSYISPSEEKLTIKIAYYKDSSTDGEKPDIPYEEIIKEVETKSRAVIEHTSKDSDEVYLVQKVSMVRNGKHLYYIEKWFSLYIHDQDDKSYDLSELKIGAKITAKREPSNPYDPNAVMVKQGEKKIGYLYAEMRDLAQDHLKNGGSISGYVTEFNENDGRKHIYVALLFYK